MIQHSLLMLLSFYFFQYFVLLTMPLNSFLIYFIMADYVMSYT